MEAMQERIEEFNKRGKECTQRGTKQRGDNQAVENDCSTKILIEEFKRTGKECQQSVSKRGTIRLDENQDVGKDKKDYTQAENSGDEIDNG